ncbi:phosphatase PAP2 family protein [Candidatus Amesbacteria bacterium]|nr:phosphatase PAP2 family protein [Candidatus Amesbacteria bacterium]
MQFLMQMISAPGEMVPFFVGLALLVGWFLCQHKYKFAGLFATANLFTIAIVQILKRIVAEPRPVGASETGFGFPSQHVASYVVLWGILIYITKNKLLKLLGILMIILVGISRVYLGEHYVIDVVGGYIVGFMVLWLSWWSWSRFYLQKS